MELSPGYSPSDTQFGVPKQVRSGIWDLRFGDPDLQIWGLGSEMGPIWDPFEALYWTRIRGSPPRPSLDGRAGTWPLGGALSPWRAAPSLVLAPEVASP